MPDQTVTIQFIKDVHFAKQNRRNGDVMEDVPRAAADFLVVAQEAKIVTGKGQALGDIFSAAKGFDPFGFGGGI